MFSAHREVLDLTLESLPGGPGLSSHGKFEKGTETFPLIILFSILRVYTTRHSTALSPRSTIVESTALPLVTSPHLQKPLQANKPRLKGPRPDNRQPFTCSSSRSSNTNSTLVLLPRASLQQPSLLQPPRLRGHRARANHLDPTKPSHLRCASTQPSIVTSVAPRPCASAAPPLRHRSPAPPRLVCLTLPLCAASCRLRLSCHRLRVTPP